MQWKGSMKSLPCRGLMLQFYEFMMLVVLVKYSQAISNCCESVELHRAYAAFYYLPSRQDCTFFWWLYQSLVIIYDCVSRIPYRTTATLIQPAQRLVPVRIHNVTSWHSLTPSRSTQPREQGQRNRHRPQVYHRCPSFWDMINKPNVTTLFSLCARSAFKEENCSCKTDI